MHKFNPLGLLLAGALLAACSQQTQQAANPQVGSLGAARMVPRGAQANPNGMVLHPGFHVQGLQAVNPSVMQAINSDFQTDVQNYQTKGSAGYHTQSLGRDHGHRRGGDSGRTEVTTIGALKAKGLFTADPYVNSTQVVLKTAHGSFKDVYDNSPKAHSHFHELVAIYDPQTGTPLGVGLPTGR